MTQPGTTGNAIPRGRDWIARDLADLRRMIRRLGASASTAGAGPLAAGSYLTSGSHAVPATLTLVTESTTFGDLTPYFALDSPGVDCLVTGWYQAAGFAAIDGLTPGAMVRISITGSIDTVNAYGIADSLGEAVMYVSTIPFYSTSSTSPLLLVIDGASGTAHISFLDVVKLSD